MKRILVTGKNSFIGNAFRDYMAQFAEYTVDMVSVRDGAWKKIDFFGYDSVFHVAGIVHANAGKTSVGMREIYYSINTELTIALAEKAKMEGVGQFIFMSSAAIYGNGAPIGKKRVITEDTLPSPANFYGNSKLKAEEGLRKLESNLFKVVILRPPMIYGKGCKGNYPVMMKFAKKLPVFPKVENERSMLYVGNLVEFVRLMVANGESGIFWPCNKEYSNTSELVKKIAAAHGKKILLMPGCGWMLRLLRHISGSVDKAFGNFMYEPHLGDYCEEYRKYSLEESIWQTEGDR